MVKTSDLSRLIMKAVFNAKLSFITLFGMQTFLIIKRISSEGIIKQGTPFCTDSFHRVMSSLA